MNLRLRRIGIAPLPLAALLTLAFAMFGVGEALIYQSVLLELLLSVFGSLYFLFSLLSVSRLEAGAKPSLGGAR